MRSRAPLQVARAKSLRSVFEILRGYPSLGGFLAFQFAIDLNYSELIDFQDPTFVVAGPGARNGIRKCFTHTAGLDDDDVIRIVAERAELEFAQQGISFQSLWGRPLQLIDCQNLLCEVDKYARVAHPEVKSLSRRTRIKQRFSPESGAARTVVSAQVESPYRREHARGAARSTDSSPPGVIVIIRPDAAPGSLSPESIALLEGCGRRSSIESQQR